MQLRLISFLLIALLSSGASHAADAPAPAASAVEAKPGERVRMQVLNSQSQEGVGAGFTLRIEGWESMGTVVIAMVGPKGEQLMVVPPDKALKLDQSGIASVFIPYELKGLYPGTWVLVAAGNPGIRQIRVQIPPPEAPESSSRSAPN